METQIKIPHTEYRKIAKRRIAGETLVSIAKSYNATRERIRQILKDQFPEITAEVAGRARRKILDREREKQTQLCACGCEMIIPIWRKRTGKNETQYWGPAAHYVSGHQGRNRVPYKRTSIDRARISETAKRNWVAGKYNNKILKKTIIMRRKLWKILKEHPEGLTVKEIMEITGIKKTTLIYWIKTQQYMKFDAHRGKGPGRPYIIKLAKEPPVNLEDEMCSPLLNLEKKRHRGDIIITGPFCTILEVPEHKGKNG